MNQFANRGSQYKLTNATKFYFVNVVKGGVQSPTLVNGANFNNIDEYFFLDEIHPTK